MSRLFDKGTIKIEPGGSPSFAKMAADQKAEDLFLSQLASFSKSGRSDPSKCSPKKSTTNHCPMKSAP
jgi:hypothetical protein